MRAAGDNSDDTLIALARVGIAETGNYNTRFDLVGAIAAAEEALKALAPVVAKPNAPNTATWTQASLHGQLGFAWLRRGKPDKSIENYLAARKIAAASGALDLSNLVATAGYVSAGWTLGEALTTIGKPDEAMPILLETIKLADKLIEKRPGHRLALRAKAIGIGQLGAIEETNLHWADVLRYARESQRVQEVVTALDPGNSGSQNNLRVAKGNASLALFELGRVAEANTALQAMLVIDKAEKVNGFSMSNLVNWHGILAQVLAEDGKLDAADAEIKKAEQYLKSFLATTDDKGPRIATPAELASWRGRVDVLAGRKEKIDALDASLKVHIAALLARRAELGKDAGTGPHPILIGLYETAYRTMMAKDDYAGAAGYAQQQVQELSRSEKLSLSDQRDISVAGAKLALALARGGKLYDAANTIKPVLAFFQTPGILKSDAVTLKGDNAEALLAAALAVQEKPAEKQALLTQALQSVDAMPAAMKALKSYARVREEIVREQSGKP